MEGWQRHVVNKIATVSSGWFHYCVIKVLNQLLSSQELQTNYSVKFDIPQKIEFDADPKGNLSANQCNRR